MHTASHCLTFARTSGEAGQARGITAFAVPVGTPGLKVEEYLWTFNMPTDHPRVSFTDVWVPSEAIVAGLSAPAVRRRAVQRLVVVPPYAYLVLAPGHAAPVVLHEAQGRWRVDAP
jgi:hypothetical protein